MVDMIKIWAISTPFIVVLGVQQYLTEKRVDAMVILFLLMGILSIQAYFAKRHKKKKNDQLLKEIERSIRWI